MEPGDSLRYTIRLTESAGLDADGVAVTDDIPAHVTGFSAAALVVRDSSGDALVPSPVNSSTDTGGANGTGYLNITGIDVPADDYVEIVFTVTVDAGAGQGTLIDNTAAIANPNGPDETVDALQLIVQLSQIPAQGQKPLYLTTAQELTRTVPAISTGYVEIADTSTETWALSPALTQQLIIDGDAGTVPVYLNVSNDDTSNQPHSTTVTLRYAGASSGTIGSVTVSDVYDETIETVLFNVPIASDHTLAPGTEVYLDVYDDTNQWWDPLWVFPATTVGGEDTWSQVQIEAETVINVDSVEFYDAAYPGGSVVTSVLPGTTVHVRAEVSDPFGDEDITGATLDLVDPEGTLILDDSAMAAVTADGTHPKVFEAEVTIPSDGAVDYWTATVTAEEGSEGTVTDAGVGTILVTSVIGADLAISKSHSDTFFENHTARFTLRVTNYGPEAQVDPVVVTDVLPAGLTYVSSTGTGWSLTGNAADTPGAGQTTLQWTYGGTLPVAAGQSLPVITLTVLTEPGAPTSLANTAGVSPGQGAENAENNPSNNSSTDTVYPVVQDVVKTVDSDIHYSGDNGDELTYTITVTNTGAGAMTNVTVTDELPDGVSYVADSARVSGPRPVFRVTEYYVSGGFTGTGYTLVLDQNLADNYFVMVQGSDGDGATRGPDENYISLTADPFATGDLTYSGGSDRLGFTRHHNENGWRGVITVVESLSDHEGSGFILRNVARVSPPYSWYTSGTDTIANSWSDVGQVLLMGGFNGAGCDMSSTNRAHHNSCHLRFWPSGNNTINWTRNWPDLQISTSTVMAVEWGSDWTVQNTRINGSNGGGGIDSAGEYNTAAISPVNREHTWVWGTGHTDDEAIGSAGEGVALTIGNDFGTADPADGVESQLAAGIEYGWRNVDFQVWALTHPLLAVDHRFKSDGDQNSTTYDLTVDSASANRMAFITNSSDRNNDTNYPRPIWSARYTANDNIRLERRYGGRDWAAWVQGIDFSGISGGVQTVAAGAPPNLVTAGDGYSLLPGETLTVTFSVTIDDPTLPDTLVNTVFVTSDGSSLPSVSSATTVVRTLGIPEFTDVDGNAKTPGASYDISQEQIYLHVYDPDRNTDPNVRESVTVTVTNPDTGDSETYTLYETGTDTGDFAYVHPTVQSPESNTDANAVETIQWNIVNPETGLTETITLTETGPDTGIFENTEVWIRHVLPLADTPGSSGDGLLYLDPESGTDPDLEIAYADPANPDRDNATAFAAVATRAVIWSFEAVDDGGRTVVVWRTISEAGTMGFYLERLDPATGTYSPLHARLLPGLLNSSVGGTYRFVDHDAVAGHSYTYRLVELEAPNRTNILGEFTVTVASSDDYDDLPSFQGDFHRTANSSAPGAVVQPIMMGSMMMAPMEGDLETGDVLKVPVTENGLVHVSAEALATRFGKDPDDVMALIGAGQLAVTLAGDAVRYMAAEDNAGIYFYGQAPESIYTAENIYLVSEGSGLMLPLSPVDSDLDGDGSAGLTDARAALQIMVGISPAGIPDGHPVAEADIDGDGKVGPAEALYALQSAAGLRGGGAAAAVGTSAAEAGVAYFSDTAHFEVNDHELTDNLQDLLFDHWVWATLIAGDPPNDALVYSFAVPHPVLGIDESATISIALRGVTETAADEDHRIQVVLNDTLIGEEAWDGSRPRNVEFSFPADLLEEGEGANTVTIKALLPAGGLSYIGVDGFDLSYPRYFKAQDNRLAFTAGTLPEVTVTGFTALDIHVFDITDPDRPMQVAGTMVSGADGVFEVRLIPASAEARYLALTLDKALSQEADAIDVDAPSALSDPANEGEYLIITPEELSDTVQRLADYRQGQGMSVKIALLEDVMDEFNHGIFTPEAIRIFLSHARDNWAIPPSYVVLIGSGNVDFKNYTNGGENLMPPEMVASPHGLLGSDNILADLDGADNVPDVAIGRLPASTADGLNDIIDKIIAYESQAPASWQKKIIMTADSSSGDGAAFAADSDRVAALIPGSYTTDKIYLDSGSIQARNTLYGPGGINDGALLFNFIGHGSYVSMSTLMAEFAPYSVFDVTNLGNGDKMPVVTAFSCSLGRFDRPGTDYLSGDLILKADGGAVAVFSSSGFSINAKARYLNEELFRAVFEDGQNVLGDAVVQALRRYRQRTGDTLVPRTYNLLGDPALRLPLVRTEVN